MQERRPDPALSAETYVRRAWKGASAVALAVVVIDQITKSLAERHLQDAPVHVIGPLDLALGYNRGIAFGVATGIAPFLVAATIAGVLFVVYKNHQQIRGPAIVAVGLVLGGAIGNLCDRLFRGRGGAVVDFIDIGVWPTFNVADASVVLGAFILVLWGSRRPAEGEGTR